MNSPGMWAPSADFRFTSTDGVRVACARWDARGPVRGMVQIAHGMGEHIGRYAGLIDALVGAGVTVYGNDHRGHGRTATSAADFGDFGDGGFEPARTPFDWLSRDTAVVDAFVNDPLCFAQLQPRSLGAFLAAAPRLCDPISLDKIRYDLPIYLFSGSEDPVGQELEGVKVLIGRYQKAGIGSISHDFYTGGRHEMLNEINRDEVRKRLLGWISSLLEHGKVDPAGR